MAEVNKPRKRIRPCIPVNNIEANYHGGPSPKGAKPANKVFDEGSQEADEARRKRKESPLNFPLHDMIGPNGERIWTFSGEEKE